MKTLPDSLSRKGISAEFDKLTPVAWEKLFERENQNGLVKARVPGDMQDRVYYSVEAVTLWLVRNDYYTRLEIEEKLGLRPSGPQVRRHIMAGA